MPSCPPLLVTAIRRDILSVLAESEALTVPAAATQVATGWSGRRRRLGQSPSSAEAIAALAYEVGADLASDLAADRTGLPLTHALPPRPTNPATSGRIHARS